VVLPAMARPVSLPVLALLLLLLLPEAAWCDNRAKLNADPQFVKAESLCAAGHAAPARAILQKLCAKSYATPEMLSCLVDTYLNDLEIDDAGMKVCETSLNRALAIDPNYGRAYKNLAKLSNMKENYKATVTFATRALQVTAPDKAALRQRALAYDKLRMDAPALADINSFIGPGTTDPRDYLIKASILENLKREDEAVAAYKQAQKLKYSDSSCKRIVGILEHQNKFAAAITTVSELIKYNPADAHAYHIRAKLEEKAKNNKAALADLTQAISLEPAIVLYKDRAALYKAMGQPQNEKADLKMIEKIGSRDF